MRAMPKKIGHQPSSAAFWVKGVAETLKAEGLDVSALFHEAGLNTTALSDPDSRFPTERVSLLWQLAVARSGNPAIGLATSNIVKPKFRCRRLYHDVVPAPARRPGAPESLCRHRERRGQPRRRGRR